MILGQTTLSACAGDAISILCYACGDSTYDLPAGEWSATGCRNRFLTEIPLFRSPLGQIVIFSLSVTPIDETRLKKRVASGSLSVAACCASTPGQGPEEIEEWRVPEVWQGVFDPVRKGLPRASEDAVTGTKKGGSLRVVRRWSVCGWVKGSVGSTETAE